MTTPVSTHTKHAHDPSPEIYYRTTLGFWIYLMSDCLLFVTFFTTYAVLKNSTFGGPTSQELYSLSTAFIETMILLFSSVTCGLAMLAAVKSKKEETLTWLAVTFILGASFLAIEFHEFYELVQAGHSWRISAFLSSFFALVGTHGLHVLSGLVWLSIMMAQIALMGIQVLTFRRLVLFSLFWHFLDLIWIFIFTLVYLMGVI